MKKFNMDYNDIFEKLFVLGFIWMTPLSFVGIIRSGLLWVLVNGVEMEIPIRDHFDTESTVSYTLTSTEESVASSTLGREEKGEEESIASSPQTGEKEEGEVSSPPPPEEKEESIASSPPPVEEKEESIVSSPEKEEGDEGVVLVQPSSSE